MEKIINIKGIDFKVLFDMDKLIETVDLLSIHSFEEDCFVEIESFPEDDGYLSEEEYKDNIISFKDLIKDTCLKTNFDKIVEYMPKKINDTFCKNRVKVIGYYQNSIYISDWHNSWITYELRFCAINDKTLELQIVKKTLTPG